MIIDFHTHTFPDNIAEKALESLSHSGHVNPQRGGTVSDLVASMGHYGIDWSINLTVMTRTNQVEHVHNRLISNKNEMESKGIIAFGGMHPDYENYKAEIRRLRQHGISGIKIHPAFARVDINDMRYKRIISAACEEDMIVVTHAGEDISYLGKNYASVSQIEDVMRDVAPDRLVLAHMGGWQDWKQVADRIAGMPLWLDTAFSLGEVHIRKGDTLPYSHQMSNQEFVKLVRKHGADRVLFGTDSPWENQGRYIEMIKGVGLEESECSMILGENARRLLKL